MAEQKDKTPEEKEAPPPSVEALSMASIAPVEQRLPIPIPRLSFLPDSQIPPPPPPEVTP